MYQISNKGRIKSNTRKIIDSMGRPRTIYGKFIAIQELPNGYQGVNLSKNDIRETKLIHRLLAEAFISNPDNFPVVNHKNHIRNDNRLENLEWCTQSENLLHSSRNGRHNGSAIGGSKLKEEDIPRIFDLYIQGVSQEKIGELYGVGDTTIGAILKRINWGHINIDQSTVEKCNQIRKERYSNYFKK